MKIGVIADSHDRLPTLRAALAMFRRMKVDAILHAGDIIAPFAAKLLVDPSLAPDCPLHCVYGNNDGERAGLKQILPQIIDGAWRKNIDGCEIAMHHFIEWFNPAQLKGAHIVISGHTHAIVNETRHGVLYLNPGECCGYLTDRCTVALLDTDTREAQIIEVSA